MCIVVTRARGAKEREDVRGPLIVVINAENGYGCRIRRDYVPYKRGYGPTKKSSQERGNIGFRVLPSSASCFLWLLHKVVYSTPSQPLAIGVINDATKFAMRHGVKQPCPVVRREKVLRLRECSRLNSESNWAFAVRKVAGVAACRKSVFFRLRSVPRRNWQIE